MTTSSGPARTSATSAGSSTSGGPNSRITTARTPGLLQRKRFFPGNEPKGVHRAAQRAEVLGPSPDAGPARRPMPADAAPAYRSGETARRGGGHAGHGGRTVRRAAGTDRAPG